MKRFWQLHLKHKSQVPSLIIKWEPMAGVRNSHAGNVANATNRPLYVQSDLRAFVHILLARPDVSKKKKKKKPKFNKDHKIKGKKKKIYINIKNWFLKKNDVN